METTAIPPGGTYRVQCGWCGRVAEPPRCGNCGRDPEQAWAHRGLDAPRVAEGRPTLDEDAVRLAYTRAVDELREDGKPVTVEAIAEKVDRSPRTVREWRKRLSLG
jgi:hypothetical protein